jgi:CRP-like cAMP-binding protein
MTTKLQTILQILQTVPVFQRSRVADLELLARSIKYIYASRKEVLYRQGDPCEGFHIVVYGRIKMSLKSWNGTDKPLQLIETGCCFGDITMFNGEPYFMDVQALEDCALLYIPRKSIVELIERDSQFAMSMLGSLAARVRGLVGDIESFSLQPPVTRLVTYLLRLLPENCAKSAKVDLSISKQVVAARLNLAPETLSRHFKELSDMGLVSVQGRTVLVHDVDKLGTFLGESSKRLADSNKQRAYPESAGAALATGPGKSLAPPRPGSD